MKKSLAKGNINGFTLIELLVTISIVAIMLTVVTPSFSEFIYANKLRSTRDLLISSLRTAQQQALRRSIPVSLCPSTDGSTCKSSWSSVTGWLVYEDNNRSNTLNAGDEIIVTQEETGIKSISGVATVQFRPTGHISSATTTFTLCSKSTTASETLIEVTRLGKIEESPGGICQ